MRYIIFAAIVALLAAVDFARAADKPAKTEAVAEQMIQKFDKNGDKALDATELGAAIAEHKEQHAKKAGKVAKESKGATTESLIKRFDTNGDGKLDATELKSMLDALHAEHEAHKKAAVTP